MGMFVHVLSEIRALYLFRIIVPHGLSRYLSDPQHVFQEFGLTLSYHNAKNPHCFLGRYEP